MRDSYAGHSIAVRATGLAVVIGAVMAFGGCNAGPEPHTLEPGLRPGCGAPDCPGAPSASETSDGGTETDGGVTLMGECTTGQCDPKGNGRGIYAAAAEDHCLEGPGTPGCLEGFVNTSAGVNLLVRPTQDAPIVNQVELQAFLDSAPVTVTRITSDQGRLLVQYQANGQPGEAREGALSALAFKFKRGEVEYELKVSEKPVQEGIQRYEVLYRPANGHSFKPYCKGEALDTQDTLVSFLPRRKVDGVTARVTPDDNATTMGCASGAIVSCMAWGYTPWGPTSAPPASDREYAYGSCLQAKRAAYFVGHGDFNSYTRNGTRIRVRDAWGIVQNSLSSRVEALWSPTGAVCLNLDSLRLDNSPEHVQHVADLARKYQVPPCKPEQWLKQATLATAPAWQSAAR